MISPWHCTGLSQILLRSSAASCIGCTEDATIAETAHLLGLTEAEVLKIAENAAETLRGTLVEAGLIGGHRGRARGKGKLRTQCLPQPVEDRRRVAAATAGAETIGTTELKPEQEMDQ